MSIAFVLDENLRGPLWTAILTHNSLGVDRIDVTRVEDPIDLPCGTSDPDLLVWAEARNRISITQDENTMPTHLTNHLMMGRHSPGVGIIRDHATIPSIVYFLRLATYASNPVDWIDRYQYIP